MVLWGSMIIKSNGIETVCHQKNPSNDVKYITHAKCTCEKNGNVHKKYKKEERPSKIIWFSFKNETVVLRMIYKNTLKMFQRLQPPMVELSVL